MTHLFDGYALIQKVAFSRGAATYRSRLVRSGSLVDAEKAGRPVRAEFGQPLSLLSRLYNLVGSHDMTGARRDAGVDVADYHI